MNILFDYVADLIAGVSTLDRAEIRDNLEAPKANMGDVALPCFKFAKNLHRAPIDIADELATNLANENIEKIESINGFLNITFKPEFLAKTLLENVRLDSESITAANGMAGKTVLIEHTSINPNASPHIGRARNALIGDSLVRVFRFLGWKTDVHYFVNDVGKQIAMLVYATRDKAEVNFNDLLQIYIDINEQLKTHPEIETAVFEILAKFEHGDSDTIAAFRRIVDTCIKGQTAIFAELGIYWDKFDYESRYIHEHITDKVLNELRKSPTLFEAPDGRLVLDQHGENIGIQDPMLVVTRNDKTSLYALRDICYSIDKANSGADRNLMVLGEDQKVYFQQIAAALRLLGSQPAEVVHYSFVLLPDGKMSTRQGNVVLLEDFMAEAAAKANEAITARRGAPDTEKAKVVGYGAIKYSILKCSPEKNVLFDWDTALNFNGDSSVYAQYNYARIQSILEKADIDYQNADYSLLVAPEESALIKEIANFESVVLNVYRNLNPAPLANYVFNLTSKFSQFYTNHKILGIDDTALAAARLNLIDKTATAIKNALYLLGIDTVDQL